jgi:hypothetical protein
MKKYSLLLYIAFTAFAFTSCIKQVDKTYTGATVVEVDQTVLNGVTTGLTYPILTRIPLSGRPIVAASDSTIRRWNSATPTRIRINLVGPQSTKDETVSYTISNTPPVATIAFGATLTSSQAPPSGQTPSTASGTLTLVAATAGTHYTIAGTSPAGIITIPANSSYGYLDILMVNAGATAGQARYIGIELTNNGSIKPNPNYNKIGIAIDQR